MTIRRPTTFLGGAAALVLTALAIVGCGGSDDTATPTTSSGSPATIGVANEGDLGKILVDVSLGLVAFATVLVLVVSVPGCHGDLDRRSLAELSLLLAALLLSRRRPLNELPRNIHGSLDVYI